MHSVDTAMKNQNYMGVPFENADQAKSATLLWIEGGYAKRFGSLKALQTDNVDQKTGVNKSLKAREDQLINEWKNKVGGTNNKKPMTADEFEQSLKNN